MEGRALATVISGVGTYEDTKEWKGYTKLQRLNAASGEKTIWSGTRTDAEGNTEPCVLCFAKADAGDSALETLQREARILQNLEGSEYIIKVLEFILDWGGEGGPACLVLEEVEPLGYDLFEVFMQHSRSCRPVPLAQVRHYTHQLVQALRHLGKHRTVHRDVKPENVLVDSKQNIRLIDFGFAIQPPEFSFVLPEGKRPQYAAPEVLRKAGMGDDKTDLWGVGCVLYFLCVGCQMSGKAVKNWDKEGSFDKNLEAMGVHKLAIEPIKGLLRQNPDLRWSLDQLDEWATSPEKDEPAMFSSSFSSLSFRVANRLRRFPYRGIVPAVIGARLPADWNRSTIEDLKLGDQGKILVLLVVRNSGSWVKCYPFASSSGPGKAAYRDVFSGALTTTTPSNGTAMEVVTDPNAATVLAPEDWVYFGIPDSDSCCLDDARTQMDFISERLGISRGDDSDGGSASSSLSLARSVRRERLIHDFPEFDGFELPSYCVNAVLGPPQFAKEGQNALNVRRNFGINIAGLHHADDTVTWWPGGGEIVRPGDRGLIVRVPCWTSDTNFISPPTVSLETLDLLLDREKFRTSMGLKSKDKWSVWTKNCKRLDSGTRAAKTLPCCAVS